MPGQATQSKHPRRKQKKGGHGRHARDERKRLTRRLRDVLSERALELPEMIGLLEASEPEVLEGLRVLGKKTRGRLRSGVLDGRNCWWWDPPPQAALVAPDDPALESESESVPEPGPGPGPAQNGEDGGVS
jgi:hypothetical protein